MINAWQGPKCTFLYKNKLYKNIETETRKKIRTN